MGILVHVNELVLQSFEQIGGDQAVGVLLLGERRHGRDDVVEETVVFVVIDEEDGLAPQLWIGGQRFEDRVDVERSIARGSFRMLRVLVRRDDPGHLRQLAIQTVFPKASQGAIGNTLLHQRAVGGGSFFDLILGKEFEGVVGEVVGWVAGNAGAALVELPAHAGCFEAFGVGRPGVAVGPGAFAEAGTIGLLAQLVASVDGAGPEIDTVRRGIGVDRAVVRVADGEGVGESVMEGNVFPAQISHGEDVLLLGDPLVVAAVVPGLMAAAPAVVGACLELGGLFGVDVEGQNVLGAGMEATVVIAVGLDAGGRLVPDRFAVGQMRGPRIAEAPYSAEGAEVVVKGAVLLHQDHHVFNIANGAGGSMRGDGKRFANAGRNHGGAGCGRSQTQEVSPGPHRVTELLKIVDAQSDLEQRRDYPLPRRHSALREA